MAKWKYFPERTMVADSRLLINLQDVCDLTGRGNKELHGARTKSCPGCPDP